jgi:hypothetical protein
LARFHTGIGLGWPCKRFEIMTKGDLATGFAMTLNWTLDYV